MQEPCPAAELLPQGWSCCSSSTTSSVSPHHIFLHSRAPPWPLPSRGGAPHTAQSLPPSLRGSDKAFPTPQTTQMLKSHQLGGGSSDSWWLGGGSVLSEMAWRPRSAPYQGGAPSCLCLAVVKRPAFLWLVVVSVNLWT